MDDQANALDDEITEDAPVLDPSVQANTTAVRIQKALRFLIVATVILGLVLTGVGIYVFSFVSSNTKALCALRDDSQRRVNETEAFIRDNPKGIPGVPNEQLKRSAENSKTTVKALNGLKCGPLVPLPGPETKTKE